MSRDAAYLLDILLMAKDAMEFTKDLGKKDFLSDKIRQYAVIRCFEVIGEATKKLSDNARKAYPQVPWSAMAKTRDLLIHAYSKVDINEVWDTVKNDLPPLVAELEKIVPSEEKK